MSVLPPRPSSVRRSVAVVLAAAVLPVALVAGPAAAQLTSAPVAASAVAPAPVAPVVLPRGQRAVIEAARHRGKPYRMGATGPRAFDCSGYTGYVYRQLGVRLPRTAAEQLRATRRISQSAKRPGDLLFMTSGGRVSHVGIYAGAGKWWVAPKTGDVVKLQRVYTSRYVVGRVR